MKIRLFTLPNLVTIGNLLCGCMAVVSALVWGDLTLAFWFVVCGAVCDFFDGMVARLMGISGPLGVQLDSLADDISFGFAPSVVLFVLFNRLNAGLLPEWLGYTAFLFAAFAALRLAKFNIDEEQHTEFRGLPTPAATLVVVSLGLMEERGLLTGLEGWFILLVGALLAWQMVRSTPMFSLKFQGFGWRGNELRYGFLAVALLMLVGLGLVALPFIILLYVALSNVRSAIKRLKS